MVSSRLECVIIVVEWATVIPGLCGISHLAYAENNEYSSVLNKLVRGTTCKQTVGWTLTCNYFIMGSGYQQPLTVSTCCFHPKIFSRGTCSFQVHA